MEKDRGRVSFRFGIGGQSQHHAVLVGPGSELSGLSGMLSRRSSAVILDGVFSDDTSWVASAGLKLLGTTSDLLPWLETKPDVDEVYYSMGSLDHPSTLSLYGLCQRCGARCVALPAGISALQRRMNVSHEGDVVMLSLRNEPLSQLPARMLKRIVDIIISLLFLLTVFPVVYVVVAILTKWKNPGPVFLTHLRCGMNGRRLHLLTFRRAGHGLLAHMPLMLSVLRGDLSLVGPHPLRLSHLEGWLRLVNRYVQRYPVKPGLTGLAQQMGLGEESANGERLRRRAEADIRYMENWTLWTDVRLLLTAPFGRNLR